MFLTQLLEPVTDAPKMFAGYFQTACYTNLNGVNGLAGWRWLFIVCGCITLPVAFLGLAVFPARPDSKNPSWLLTADQIALARCRVSEGGSEAPKVKLDRKAITDVFKSWHWYGFVFLYFVFNQAMITNGQPFNLYLKAHDDRYTISQINNLPTGQSALSIVTALVGCYWADATGKRWLPSIWICGFMTIGAVCMAAWNIPEGLKFFAFYVAGLGGALNPLFMSWASEVTFRSAEERAVVVASMNAVGQALLAGLNIVTFPTPQVSLKSSSSTCGTQLTSDRLLASSLAGIGSWPITSCSSGRCWSSWSFTTARRRAWRFSKARRRTLSRSRLAMPPSAMTNRPNLSKVLRGQ